MSENLHDFMSALPLSTILSLYFCPTQFRNIKLIDMLLHGEQVWLTKQLSVLSQRMWLMFNSTSALMPGSSSSLVVFFFFFFSVHFAPGSVTSVSVTTIMCLTLKPDNSHLPLQLSPKQDVRKQ